ncbi:MAG: DUF421 domain-containing protein [Clostridia bacterium]|nr:DUF421 domain-containing protein [Clostridia bacterium]
MLIIFIRTLITYFTLVVVIRLMGKRQIGEMQPFEFIVTLIIADLACVPMSDVSIPLIYGVVSILALFLLHQLLSLFEQKSLTVKKIISGRPSLVINKDGVDITELKKNNIGVEDLLESMRTSGYFSLDQVDYAIFESNGKFSAMESGENPSASSLPLLIVDDGRIVKRNLRFIGKSENEVAEFIKKQDGKLKATEVLTVDGNGRVYMKERNRKYRICRIELTEGLSW